MISYFDKKIRRRSRKILIYLIYIRALISFKIKNINDDNYIFENVWDFIYTNNLLEIIFPKNPKWFYHSFQLNKTEYLVFELIDILRDRGIDCSPKIHIDDKKLLEEFSSPTSQGIIVSVHTGFAFNMKIMSDIGRKVTTISSHPSVKKVFVRSGVKAPVNVIHKDRYCLAFLKQEISNGSLACCAVDFKYKGDQFEFISPALFIFAKKFDIPLFYSRSRVLNDGSLCVSLKRSSPDLTPMESANAFIEFINAQPGQPRKLSIKEI